MIETAALNPSVRSALEWRLHEVRRRLERARISLGHSADMLADCEDCVRDLETEVGELEEGLGLEPGAAIPASEEGDA